jgi:hypothetical protein
VEVDPLASMRCWALELELGGRTFDVPALPAADWWPVLVSGDLSQILDFVVSTSGDLDEMLLAGEVTQDQLSQALTDAVEETAGRPLHAARVLASLAAMHWVTINGEMAKHGFRWEVMPLGAALDAIYLIAVNGIPEKSEDGKRRPRDEFLALLENEALTSGKPTPRQRAKLVDEFEGMAGPRPTAGVRSTGELSGSGRPKTRTRPRPPRQADPSREPTPPREPPAGSDPVASS